MSGDWRCSLCGHGLARTGYVDGWSEGYSLGWSDAEKVICGVDKANSSD